MNQNKNQNHLWALIFYRYQIWKFDYNQNQKDVNLKNTILSRMKNFGRDSRIQKPWFRR